MQGNTVPNSAFLNLWRKSVANLGKCRLQCLQPGKLLRVGVERNANDGIHIGSILTTSYMNILQRLKIIQASLKTLVLML
jgi:hypothetical protein